MNESIEQSAEAQKFAMMSAEALKQMQSAVYLPGSNKPYLVLADGPQSARLVDLDKFQGPQRNPKIDCQDIASFCQYVNDFKEDYTRIFCDFSRRCFGAVIDFHEPKTGTAGACQHRVNLGLKLSQEAEAWTNKSDRMLTQVDFADFLEDHYVDVVDPTGADMLEIAKTLEMKLDVNFKSAQRQHDAGYNLIYQENAQTSAGAHGQLTVPEKIKLRIPIFEGSDCVEIEARLLYRMRDGVLTFGIRFIRLEDMIREAVKAAYNQISQETELPIYCARSLLD